MTAHAEEAPDVSNLHYIIKDGSPYYESSWGCGSGRYGIVGAENKYTDVPCVVGLNGYSFLDENGNVLASDYIEEETDIIIPDVPDGAVKLFMHFHGPVYRNGWTDAQNIELRDGEAIGIPEKLWPFYYPDGLPFEPIEEEIPQFSSTPSKEFEDIISEGADNGSVEKTPEQVANDICAIAANSKTAVLVDVSGSMQDCYKAVLSYLERTEFPEDTIFLAFTDEVYEVFYDELLEMVSASYGYTNIHGALNYVTNFLEVDTVILLSDMIQEVYNLYGDLIYVKIEENSAVNNLAIYQPPDNERYLEKETEAIKGKWDASISSFVIEEN